MKTTVAILLSRALEQLRANARLRLGLISIVAILWSYGLLLVGDQVERTRAQSQQFQEELSRIAPLAREKYWPDRAEEARKQVDAVQSLRWTDSDLGLVEARFQDWIRTTVGSAGLTVRDLALSRGAPEALAAGSVPVPPQPNAGHAQKSVAIKARVTADLNLTGLLAFLAEAGRHERIVVVDRLVLRLSSQPPLAEVDLRILAAEQLSKEPQP